jgi:PAS domain S-box-containing protein
MSEKKIQILERALLREKESRKQAEAILEKKSYELFKTNQKLESTNKMMEALLQDKSSQMNIIFENSSLGIFLSSNGKLLETNSALHDILGYSKKDFIKLTIADVSHPDDVKKSLKFISKINNGLINEASFKKRYKCKDGNYIICKTNVRNVKNANGEVKYQVVLIEDITDSERNSRMLKTLNNLSASILGKRDLFEISWEIANNIAKHLRLEDCVIYLYNKDKQLIQTASLGDKIDINNKIKNPLTIKLGEGIVGAVAKLGKPLLVNDTSNDSRYVVDNKSRMSELAVPIIANGKVIGVIDSENSEKYYFKNEHLNVFKNIANLASAQFNSAISLENEKVALKDKNNLLLKLEKSNEELKNFAHVVSHDLKSPLRSMSALISWIQQDNESIFDFETVENFERLLKKVDKMDHLINGILKYSSIDKVNDHSKNINTHKIVEEIIQIIHIPKNISIKINSRLPNLYADKFRVQQLFQNLISNAIKYNDKEIGEIIIDFSENSDSYIFSIKDNGIGIDKKYHKKIFDVFETLEEPDENSTGIGLSIVKKIINMFGGRVWLESKVGEETTFYFELKNKVIKI